MLVRQEYIKEKRNLDELWEGKRERERENNPEELKGQEEKETVLVANSNFFLNQKEYLTLVENRVNEGNDWNIRLYLREG